MKVNIKDIQKIYSSIPKRYEVDGQITDGYNLLTEQHYADGWRDYVEETLLENQKLNTVNVLENDIVIKKAIDMTTEEIEAANKNKLESYRAKIYEITEKLNNSAKARSLGKQKQGLTIVQLNRLELVYKNKNELAKQYLLDSTILNEVSFSTIIFESENDFTSLELDQTIMYLNATYSFGIPETGLTIVEQYCYIIVYKFILGSQLDITYNSFIEAFRSKLITNIDKSEYNRADARMELVETITNDTTLDDILVLKDQFYAI
jgi:hypothetical protein